MRILRVETIARAALAAAIPLLVGACSWLPSEDDPDPAHDTGEEPAAPTRFAPAEARLHRLTATEYRASVGALVGVPVTSPLPVDYRLHGFTSIGASELSIASADLEQYETAAWQVATDALPDQAATETLVGCPLATTEDPQACVGPWAADLAHRAWRRPIDADDVDQLVDVYEVATDISRQPTVGARAVVATILQSPWFLFRVEVGTVTDDPAMRRLTDHELAARLAAFLSGGPPDALLLADADTGILSEDEVLAGQVERLLAEPEAEAALAGFFRELLDLDRLATVDKDPDLYPMLTPSLRQAMAAELEALFTDVVLTRDDDVRSLLTSDRAWVTPALAAHYGMSTDTPSWITLPPDQERGGLLGRAGFLTVESHAAATSPTHRGLFVQTRLLCNSVPPPPEGVDTTLPDDDPDHPRTTRDRLSQHANDPACSGCHDLMDPMGLTLERYDAVGRFRTHENGLVIDTTGQVDGQPIDGAAELGLALAEHPKLPACLVRQLYRHAIGQHESDSEIFALDDLALAMGDRDHRLKALIVDLVLHDAFRHIAPPDGESCDTEGAHSHCVSACGVGTRVCEDGRWRDCSARTALPETCNGIDDDCDGTIDEAVRTCETALGLGLESCADGDWSGTCDGPPPQSETCNDVDDDGDGEVDEDLQVDVVRVGFGDLVDAHEACVIAGDASSGPCKAAIHRTCADRSCSATGWGPIARDGGSGTATLACLDETEGDIQHTTYTALAERHWPCDGSQQRWGPDCNAAISRWCSDQGLTTGFGPIENSGDVAVVVCTPAATRHMITYTELAPFSVASEGPCDGSQARLGPACDAAIHGYCRDLGYRTGHGPLENHRDNLHIACVGELGEGR